MTSDHQLPLVAGIDLGGTNIQIGIADAGNTVVAADRRKTHADRGPDAVIATIVDGVRDACRRASIEVNDLAAVGIAAAGAIDIPRGVVLEAPNLGWHELPLRDMLHAQLDRPLIVENDVNAAVWGEYTLGAAQSTGDLLGVWCGTGVGGGLVLNGRIYHGGHFTAGEIGHTVALPDSLRGERTVEDLCSRTGMSRALHNLLPHYPRNPHAPLRAAIEKEGPYVGSKLLAEACAAGDELARQVVARAAEVLGVAIANWVTVLSLRSVILGGGVVEALGRSFVDHVHQVMAANVFPPPLRECRFIMTELEENAGLLGAAMLAREAAGGH